MSLDVQQMSSAVQICTVYVQQVSSRCPADFQPVSRSAASECEYARDRNLSQETTFRQGPSGGSRQNLDIRDLARHLLVGTFILGLRRKWWTAYYEVQK